MDGGQRDAPTLDLWKVGSVMRLPTEQIRLNDFYVTVHCPLDSLTGSVLINKHVSHSRTVSTYVACHSMSHIA